MGAPPGPTVESLCLSVQFSFGSRACEKESSLRRVPVVDRGARREVPPAGRAWVPCHSYPRGPAQGPGPCPGLVPDDFSSFTLEVVLLHEGPPESTGGVCGTGGIRVAGPSRPMDPFHCWCGGKGTQWSTTGQEGFSWARGSRVPTSVSSEVTGSFWVVSRGCRCGVCGGRSPLRSLRPPKSLVRDLLAGGRTVLRTVVSGPPKDSRSNSLPTTLLVCVCPWFIPRLVSVGPRHGGGGSLFLVCAGGGDRLVCLWSARPPRFRLGTRPDL